MESEILVEHSPMESESLVEHSPTKLGSLAEHSLLECTTLTTATDLTEEVATS